MYALRFAREICEGVRPLQGSNSLKSGKEGFGVKKTEKFPSAPEKGALSQKIPILYRAPQGNGDFLTQSTLFWGTWMWEFFDPKPSFPDFGVFDPCKGRTRSQLETASHDQF